MTEYVKLKRDVFDDVLQKLKSAQDSDDPKDMLWFVHQAWKSLRNDVIYESETIQNNSFKESWDPWKK